MGSAPHLRSLQDLRAEYPLTWVCARDAQRLAAVLDAVRVSGVPAVTGRSALLVHTVIQAMVESSRQGRPVALNSDIA